ncbi:MAG: helix-turn-helix transcriptional regulator [Coriobacteriia bacterium]|nr:helix-turn-helix transcriptional regulator [Coriobacteriia bacterium]
MRYFEIVDGRKRKRSKPCGLLRFDEEKREFSITISEGVSTADVPMLFIPFVEKGEREIPPQWALVWVQERIPPPNRQNIAEILLCNGLEEYDELTLLLAGEGRCSQDEFMVREVFPVDDLSEDETMRLRRSRKKRIDYAYTPVESAALVELKKEIGTQVLQARRAKGISQTELSRKSGVPQATISNIERGLANPTVETIESLANSLGVRVHVSLG